MDVYPRSRVLPSFPSVESLSTGDSFNQGVVAGRAVPSTAGAIADAITGGINAYQQGQHNSAIIRLTEARAEAEEMEARLAPLKLEATIAQHKALSMKQQAEAQSLMLASKQEELRFGRKLAVGGLLQKASDVQSPQDLAQIISTLEANPSAIADSIINIEKGKDISFDSGLEASLASLPAIAERFGDQELTARANKVLTTFKDTANRQITAASGKPISYGEEKSGGAQSDTDFMLELAERSGVTPRGQQQQAPTPQGQTAPTGAPAQPKAPVNTASATASGTSGGSSSSGSPTTSSSASAGGKAAPDDRLPATSYQGSPEDIRFPQKALEIPESLTPKTEEEKSDYQRIVEAAISRPEDHYKRTLKDLRKEFPDIDIDKLATIAERKTNKPLLNDKQETDRAKASALELQLSEGARKRINTLNRIQQLSKNYDIPLGSKRPVATIISDLLAKGGQSDDDRFFLEQVADDLNAQSVQAAWRNMQDLGVGTRGMDSNRELTLNMASFGGIDSSLERNIEVAEVMAAKAEQYQRRNAIIEAALNNGHSLATADMLATRFERTNPSTVTGKINGVEALVRNKHVPDVYEYIWKSFGGKPGELARTDEGRVIAAEPAHVTKHSSTFAEQLDKGELNKDNLPNASDVPAVQRDGANEATLKRLSFFESSFNPFATSRQHKDGEYSRGLFQIKDSTGRELWKKLKFKGEYNPYDVEKNTIMGTTYFNQMLNKYRGRTDLAIAAFNAGPGTVDAAYKTAQGVWGSNADWDDVKVHLPEETRKHVKNIMGDRTMLASEQKTLTQPEKANVLASIPSATAQENARKNLTEEGMQTLAATQEVGSFKEAAGNVVGSMLSMLFGGAEEASAEIIDEAEASAQQEGILAKLSDLVPDGVQALAIGAARQAFFGQEDELGAWMRSTFLGEDYEEALEKVKGIRAEFQANNPNLYLTGEIAGGLIGAGEVSLAAKGLKAGARAVGFSRAATGAPAASGAPTAAATVAEVLPPVEKSSQVIRIAQGGREAVKSTFKGAGAGGGFGALQGAGEADSGERTEGALKGGIIGGAFGAAASGVVSLGGSVVRSAPVVNTIKKVTNYLKGGKSPSIVFNESEKRILQRLQGMTESEALEFEKQLRSSNNEAAALLDLVGEGNLKQLADAVAKDPHLGIPIKNVAGARLDKQGQRISDATKGIADDVEPLQASEEAAAAVQSRIEAHSKTMTDAADRVLARSVGGTLPLDTLDASKKAAASVQKRFQTMIAEQKEEAKKLYEPAKAALRDPEDVKALKKKGLEAIPRFKSKEVEEALTNPEVESAVNEALGSSAGAYGKLDKTDFDVLQNAKQILSDRSKDAQYKARENAGFGHDLLKKAMHGESKTYAQADEAFQAASDKIDAFNTKGVEQLRDLTDAGKTVDAEKFIPKLFAHDGDQIRNMMKVLDPAEQQSVKQAVGAYIREQVQSKGDEVVSKYGKQIKAVLGEKTGSDLVNVFEGKSRSISGFNTKGMRDIAKFADELKTSDAEKVVPTILKQDATQIKKLMSNLDAEGQKKIQNAVYSYVKKQFTHEVERQPGESRSFPKELLQKNMPKQFKAIFGDQKGQKLIDVLTEEKRISSSANEIIGKQSATAPRQQETEKQVAQAAASALGGIKGLAVKAFSTLFSGDKTSEREIIEGVSKIIYTDKKAGIEFLQKVQTALKEFDNDEARKLWDRIVEAASKDSKYVPAKSMKRAPAKVSGQVSAARSAETDEKERQRRYGSR